MTRLITATEVAERLGVDVSTVHRWARAGEIPAFRLGRVVRFDPDAVDAWVSGQMVGAPSEDAPQQPEECSRVDRLRAATTARIPHSPA